jgi:hypothetical protein
VSQSLALFSKDPEKEGKNGEGFPPTFLTAKIIKHLVLVHFKNVFFSSNKKCWEGQK